MTYHLDNDSYVASINVASIDSAMQYDGVKGQVVINPDAVSLEEAERVLRRATRKDTTVKGANIFPRMKSNDAAVRAKSVRPIGATPVRGLGFFMFGPSPKLDFKRQSTKQAEVKWLRFCASRAQKIDDWNLSVAQEYISTLESEAKTVEDRLILEVEKHQMTTGGGYDNCTIAGFVKGVKNFAYKGYNLPALDGPIWEIVNKAIDDLIADFTEEGVQWGTLKPTPYAKVRVDQDELSTDGTIGFPVYDKGMSPASAGLAALLNNVYGIDLSFMLNEDVDDGGGYVGPCRVCDMLQELLRQSNLDVRDSDMIFTNFTRVQRHGYKHLEAGNVEPKAGKQRAIWIPDAKWGAVHACVYDAVMKHMKECQTVELTSLMKPDDRIAAMVDQVTRAIKSKAIILSIDESNFDATLNATLMYLVHMRIVAKMFLPEYQDMVKAAGVVFCYKILAISTQTWREGAPDPDQTSPEIERVIDSCTREVGQWTLVKLINGLGSGLKGTMMMGSLYNLVGQYSICHYQGKPALPHRGMGAGDDAFATVQLDFEITLETTMEEAYAIVEEWYAKLGMVVNAAKQLWIPGECPAVEEEGDTKVVFPVGQFLQLTVHPAYLVQGIGSPIRSLFSAPICETDPYHLNLPEQEMAVLSVMQNGHSCKHNVLACSILLRYDQKLLNLFQTLGVEAWDELIQEMNMPTDARKARIHNRQVLGLESKGTGSDVASAEEQINVMRQGVVQDMAKAAASMPPSTEVWDGRDFKVSIEDPETDLESFDDSASDEGDFGDSDEDGE